MPRRKTQIAELERIGVSLEDLAPHMCRWPVTDRMPHRFCGERKRDGLAYCKHHADLAYSTPKFRKPLLSKRKMAA